MWKDEVLKAFLLRHRFDIVSITLGNWIKTYHGVVLPGWCCIARRPCGVVGRLPVVVRLPAGPQVSLKCGDQSKDNGAGHKKNGWCCIAIAALELGTETADTTCALPGSISGAGKSIEIRLRMCGPPLYNLLWLWHITKIPHQLWTN